MATYNSFPIDISPQVAKIMTATKGEEVRKAMCDALHALNRESWGGDIVNIAWRGNSIAQPSDCGIYGRRYGNLIHVWGRAYGTIAVTSTAIFTIPASLLDSALTDTEAERIACAPRFVPSIVGTAASGTVGTSSTQMQLKVDAFGNVTNVGRSTSSTNYTSFDFWLDVEVYEIET